MTRKVIIFVVIIIIILALALLIIRINTNVDMNRILEKYTTSESDRFEDNPGYIVSYKTNQGYRYGYINYKGKLILKVEYNKIYRILDIGNKDEVYLIASKDGRYGVTKNGKAILNYEYQFIEYNSTNNIFILNKSGKYGIANIKGEILINIEHEKIDVKGENIYITDEEQSYVCDISGNRLEIDFNTIINKVENTDYYIKITYKDDKYTYSLADEYGENILKQDYEYLEYIFDDYFIASDNTGKQGIINSKGEVKLEFKYNLIQKIKDTKVIRTLNTETNETEIYSSSLEKVYTMKNVTISPVVEGKIKIYNQEDEIILDLDGNKI